MEGRNTAGAVADGPPGGLRAGMQRSSGDTRLVTVAFGSTLSSAILDSGVPLVESIVAFALLAALQAAVAFGAVRSDRLQELIKSEPRLLVRDGRMLHDAMRAERVSREEILQAMRNSGISELAEVEALVLETDGGFSILERVGDDGRSPLADVRGPDTG